MNPLFLALLAIGYIGVVSIAIGLLILTRG